MSFDKPRPFLYITLLPIVAAAKLNERTNQPIRGAICVRSSTRHLDQATYTNVTDSRLQLTLITKKN
uniref:Putative secreted protein n=1 Tax=Anopheles darlingi TaxID=43151 RepID=A0A2M4DR70_ANODA